MSESLPPEHENQNESTEAAIARHYRAFLMAQELDKPEEVQQASQQLGIAYLQAGDVVQAIRYQGLALNLSRQLRLLPALFEDLIGLGQTFIQVEHADDAVELFEEALLVARELTDPSRELEAVSNLGMVYVTLENYIRAIQYFSQAIVLAAKVGNRTAEASSLTRLGNVHAIIEKYYLAEQNLKNALQIAREIGNPHELQLAVKSLGMVYRCLGAEQTDLKQALWYFLQALQLFSGQGLQDEAGKVNQYIREIQQKVGQTAFEAILGELRAGNLS